MRLQSFGTSAGWSVESHVKLPLFTIEDVKQNLFFSPDKGLPHNFFIESVQQDRTTGTNPGEELHSLVVLVR